MMTLILPIALLVTLCYSQSCSTAPNSPVAYDLTPLNGLSLMAETRNNDGWQYGVSVSCFSPSGFCQQMGDNTKFNVGTFQSVVAGLSNGGDGATIKYGNGQEGRRGVIEVKCNRNATTPQNLYAISSPKLSTPYYVSFEHRLGCGKGNGVPWGSYCGGIEPSHANAVSINDYVLANFTLTVTSPTIYTFEIFYRGGKIVCSEQVKYNSTTNEIQFVNWNRPNDCLRQAFSAFSIPMGNLITVYLPVANFIKVEFRDSSWWKSLALLRCVE